MHVLERQRCVVQADGPPRAATATENGRSEAPRPTPAQTTATEKARRQRSPNRARQPDSASSAHRPSKNTIQTKRAPLTNLHIVRLRGKTYQRFHRQVVLLRGKSAG